MGNAILQFLQWPGGDSVTLDDAANAWGVLENDLTTISDQLRRDVEELLQGWTGSSANLFSTRMNDLVKDLTNASSQSLEMGNAYVRMARQLGNAQQQYYDDLEKMVAVTTVGILISIASAGLLTGAAVGADAALAAGIADILVSMGVAADTAATIATFLAGFVIRFAINFGVDFGSDVFNNLTSGKSWDHDMNFGEITLDSAGSAAIGTGLTYTPLGTMESGLTRMSINGLIGVGSSAGFNQMNEWLFGTPSSGPLGDLMAGLSGSSLDGIPDPDDSSTTSTEPAAGVGSTATPAEPGASDSTGGTDDQLSTKSFVAADKDHYTKFETDLSGTESPAGPYDASGGHETVSGVNTSGLVPPNPGP